MIKSADEIVAMRTAGKLTASVLETLGAFVRPGINTLQIDAFCERYIVDQLDARPASKGQYGYLFSVNTSVNHVICHGIPCEKQVLKEGDIVNVDVTVEKNAYIADSSKMFCVGSVASHAQRLVDVTQQCLYAAIRCVKPGARLGDLGYAIQHHAEKNNYSVVREFCGHGIGKQMHEDPQVLHFGKKGQGSVLKAGMTFTIEPMVNQGKPDIKQHKDGWTVTTKDRRLSAQWEHTVLVTDNGVEVLTLRQEEKELAFVCKA